MTPVGTASMGCPEARALLSERLDGAAVVEICERVVGDEFKATNPWAGWIS